MKMRMLALTCALSAAACGGSDSKPAADPSTTNITGASSEPVAASPVASKMDPATSTTPSSATSTWGANGSSATTLPAATPMAMAPPSSDSSSNAAPSQAAPPADPANDTKITAAVRKGILGDKTLSAGAKKVKVSTVASKVTLSGPVKSDQERTTIESLAKKAPGVSEVDNQLEVQKP